MGGCASCQSRGNGESTKNRALDRLDSSPSSSRERGSRRWKSSRGSEKRGGSVSDRIYGMVDFGFLSRGGGGGGGGGGEAELHRIRRRMFVNGASEVACLYTQQGRKGTNQDAMLVWEVSSVPVDGVGSLFLLISMRSSLADDLSQLSSGFRGVFFNEIARDQGR